MIDDAVRAHLDAGVSVIAGSVSPDGVPFATRAYGVRVIGDDLVQVFLAADEPTMLGNVRATGRLSTTTGDVYTHHSVQFKGRVESLTESTAAEEVVARGCYDGFVDKVAPLQNIPPEALREQLPKKFMTCTVRVERLFDQTPGPQAGAVLEQEPR
jgi:hypothetical protein